MRPWWTRIKPTAHYLMETEAHVYALATAASTLLAFYPFIVVMIAVCRSVFGYRVAVHVVSLALRNLFPGDLGRFLVGNLPGWDATKLSLTAVFLLLFTSNGVFEPMEVALNRAWGVTQNRSYLKNQIVSLGLIFGCGGLVALSLLVTALPSEWLSGDGLFTRLMFRLVFELISIPVAILALFLMYWILPNRKIEARRVFRVSVVVGLILEGLKYINYAVADMFHRKFQADYNIFEHSVYILVLSFVASLIILAGAHWTAKHEQSDPLS